MFSLIDNSRAKPSSHTRTRRDGPGVGARPCGEGQSTWRWTADGGGAGDCCGGRPQDGYHAPAVGDTSGAFNSQPSFRRCRCAPCVPSSGRVCPSRSRRPTRGRPAVFRVYCHEHLMESAVTAGEAHDGDMTDESGEADSCLAPCAPGAGRRTAITGSLTAWSRRTSYA